MDGIRQYLLTIIAGAMICAILLRVSSKFAVNTALIKLLTEIFMLILLVSPLLKLKLPDFSAIIDDTMISDAISDGELYADTQVDGLIKESVTAYILDKASTLNANIHVEVFLSESLPQIPESVVIYGDVSPYTKTVLKSMIADELGIPEDAQLWN